MNNFKIDIIVITRDRYNQLFDCIKHISNNSVKPVRVIIVDASSNFNSKAITAIHNLLNSKGINLIYLTIKQRGIGYSRNIGLKHIVSKYFAFIDDDEYLPISWIETVARIFWTNKKLHVLCGPKIPRNLHNYWNRVWTSLSSNEFDYKGVAKSIPAGNSVYLTSFIRKNELKFNYKLKFASEDLAFSKLLLRKKAIMYFDKDIWVHHDCRTTLFSFVKQWFFYGVGKNIYHKLYFKNKTLLRNMRSTYPYTGGWKQINTLPGLILLNIVFLFGYISGPFYANK